MVVQHCWGCCLVCSFMVFYFILFVCFPCLWGVCKLQWYLKLLILSSTVLLLFPIYYLPLSVHTVVFPFLGGPWNVQMPVGGATNAARAYRQGGGGAGMRADDARCALCLCYLHYACGPSLDVCTYTMPVLPILCLCNYNLPAFFHYACWWW